MSTSINNSDFWQWQPLSLYEKRPLSKALWNCRLEGLYANSGGAMGAVISHPHPLMGGNMSNSIVEPLAETLFAVSEPTSAIILRTFLIYDTIKQ